MKRREDLARLAAMAAMVRDVRVTQLRRNAEETARLRAGIEMIDARRAALQDAETLRFAPAVLRWHERTRADLNARLALARRAQEQGEAQARIAFGRAQILESLLERGGKGGDHAS
jgi:hypothetical protein